MKPTLHITNFSSRALHGPGRLWTMMARPRPFEFGEGWVPNLCPSGEQIRLMQAALAERKSGSGTVAMSRYRHALESQWREQGRLLSPGQLIAVQPVFPNGTTVDETPEVADGDTVCCACSRDHAAAGLCHRTWAAPFLVRAGWRVVLDGREQTNADEVNLA